MEEVAFAGIVYVVLYMIRAIGDIGILILCCPDGTVIDGSEEIYLNQAPEPWFWIINLLSLEHPHRDISIANANTIFFISASNFPNRSLSEAEVSICTEGFPSASLRERS